MGWFVGLSCMSAAWVGGTSFDFACTRCARVKRDAGMKAAGTARKESIYDLLKRPDGRCRRLGLSRNAELSFGTMKNGSAVSDLPPKCPKKKELG